MHKRVSKNAVKIYEKIIRMVPVYPNSINEFLVYKNGVRISTDFPLGSDGIKIFFPSEEARQNAIDLYHEILAGQMTREEYREHNKKNSRDYNWFWDGVNVTKGEEK